jgi:hypothetical protein
MQQYGSCYAPELRCADTQRYKAICNCKRHRTPTTHGTIGIAADRQATHVGSWRKCVATPGHRALYKTSDQTTGPCPSTFRPTYPSSWHFRTLSKLLHAWSPGRPRCRWMCKIINESWKDVMWVVRAGFIWLKMGTS